VAFSLSNLLARVAVAAIAIPGLLWIALAGGLPLALLSGGIIVLGAIEWADLARSGGFQCPVWLIAGGALAIGADIFLRQGADIGLLGSLVVVSALTVMITQRWEQSLAFASVGLTIAGVWYLSCYASLIGLSTGVGSISAEDGSRVVAALLMMVWISDSAAYFGGSAFGKTKLAPTMSPNKTWEGTACGWVGAVLGAVGAGLLWPMDTISLLELVGIGAAMGVVGQVGDLAESVLKRSVGVKDSAIWLPGHGGILDRFDSLAFVAPSTWLWLWLRDGVI